MAAEATIAVALKVWVNQYLSISWVAPVFKALSSAYQGLDFKPARYILSTIIRYLARFEALILHPLDTIKHTLESLPIAAAVVSVDGQVTFANSLWLLAEQKHRADGLMCVVGDRWPSERLYDQRLYQNLSREIGYIFDASRKRINQKGELSYLGYSYSLDIDLTPLQSQATTLCLVCIRINMNAYSGPDLPAILTPEDSLVLNSLREGVVIQDATGVITVNNPAAEKILGLSADQMRGLTNTDPNWGTILEDGSPCLPEHHPSSLAISTGRPVLDFTMGSGSTGAACKNINRNFIGIELHKVYFDIAKKTIEDEVCLR